MAQPLTNQPTLIAERLYRQFKQNGVILNPFLITNHYGIIVRQTSFSRVDVHSTINWDNDALVIHVHEDDSTAQIRLAIAHMLGHYFLHPFDKGRAFIDTYASLFAVDSLYQNKDLTPSQIEKERQANVFAYHLLMPRDELMNYWLLADDVYEMANIFDIPVSHIRRRLKSLNLM
jgi:Zn-dependent peptidase ImmA (M78 family)